MTRRRVFGIMVCTVLVLAACGDDRLEAVSGWASLRSGDSLFAETRRALTEASGLEAPHLDHPWRVVACAPWSSGDDLVPHRATAFAGRISGEWRATFELEAFTPIKFNPMGALEEVWKTQGLLSEDARLISTPGGVWASELLAEEMRPLLEELSAFSDPGLMPPGVASVEYFMYGVDDDGDPVKYHERTNGWGLTLTLTTLCFEEDGIVAPDELLPPEAHDLRGRPQ